MNGCFPAPRPAELEPTLAGLSQLQASGGALIEIRIPQPAAERRERLAGGGARNERNQCACTYQRTEGERPNHSKTRRGCEAEGNCVAARRGGEQPEASRP